MDDDYGSLDKTHVKALRRMLLELKAKRRLIENAIRAMERLDADYKQSTTPRQTDLILLKKKPRKPPES